MYYGKSHTSLWILHFVDILCISNQKEFPQCCTQVRQKHLAHHQVVFENMPAQLWNTKDKVRLFPREDIRQHVVGQLNVGISPKLNSDAEGESEFAVLVVSDRKIREYRDDLR